MITRWIRKTGSWLRVGCEFEKYCDRLKMDFNLTLNDMMNHRNLYVIEEEFYEQCGKQKVRRTVYVNGRMRMAESGADTSCDEMPIGQMIAPLRRSLSEEECLRNQIDSITPLLHKLRTQNQDAARHLCEALTRVLQSFLG